MMTDLQRMDARLEMLIQAELIAGWLQGDHAAFRRESGELEPAAVGAE